MMMMMGKHAPTCTYFVGLTLFLLQVTGTDGLLVPPPLSGISKLHRIADIPQRGMQRPNDIVHRYLSASDDDETSTATVTTTSATGVFSEPVQREAREALEAVGWARPSDDAELTSDDPFVKQIDAGIRRDFGVGLDDLLNPAKVVNLERELYNLRAELASLTRTGKSTKVEDGGSDTTSDDVAFLSTEDCDGGGGGIEAEAVRAKIAKKEADLAMERRSVFRDWLKNIFVGQAVISFGVSYVMATNPQVLFGGFDWYYSYNMDISIQVLGYWFWWLFIVPSLRSRRPKGAEKRALDIAFLGTPLVSILAPVATKDTGLIWLANFAIVAGSYGFALLTDGDGGNDDDDDAETTKQQPAWLKFVYKSLDFGSGRERGARN